jgi:cell division protein FtsX
MRMGALAPRRSIGRDRARRDRVFQWAERRREVGILRAIGATPRRVRGIFIMRGRRESSLGACALALAGGLALLAGHA